MHNNLKAYQVPSLLSADKLVHPLPPFQALKTQLSYTQRLLSANRLTASAKWAGQLFHSVTTQAEQKSSFLLKNFIENNLDRDYRFNRIYSPPTVLEQTLTLGRDLFDLREYKKCTFLLRDFLWKGSQQINFLYYYSLWMFGQFRKEEEIYQNQEGSKPPQNPNIPLIVRQLSLRLAQGHLGPLTTYILGLAFRESQQEVQAITAFKRVLSQLPCFWSCWLQLCKYLQGGNYQHVLKDLPDHWMKNFYYSSLCLERQNTQQATDINYGLLCFFKSSTYLMNQIAHGFYNSQEFNTSLEWFKKLVEVDPFRYQNMDTYSNILYIKQNQGQLANLALRCFQNNKYAPETCCVMGNYYSIMGEHYKAVVYFRKALKLDRNCLAAWTLMGHEYLQMKNISGAIQAYRNAVQIDPKDFRAWYGLGQTYQLQNMNHYALYYFSRAVMSRPRDARMWTAMASCYERMDKKPQMQKSHQRAENCKDREGIAIHKLGKLYSLMGQKNKAVQAFMQNLRRKDEFNIIDKELSECLLFLAQHFKNEGNLESALTYARRLYDFQGAEREQASALLQQINGLMTA